MVNMFNKALFPAEDSSTGWKWEKCLLHFWLELVTWWKPSWLPWTFGGYTQLPCGQKEERTAGDTGGQERCRRLASNYYLYICVWILPSFPRVCSKINGGGLREIYCYTGSKAKLEWRENNPYDSRDVKAYNKQNVLEGREGTYPMIFKDRKWARRWCGLIPGKGQSLWERDAPLLRTETRRLQVSLPSPPRPDDLWTLIFSYA